MDGGETASAGRDADPRESERPSHWAGSAWTDEVALPQPADSHRRGRVPVGRVLETVLGVLLGSFAAALVVVAVKEWDGSLVVLLLNLVLPSAFAVGALFAFRSARS